MDNLLTLTFEIIECVFKILALALASFECEPPESSHEKDRYKSLK